MLPWPSSQRNGWNHNFQQVELKVPFLLVTSLEPFASGVRQEMEYGASSCDFYWCDQGH